MSPSSGFVHVMPSSEQVYRTLLGDVFYAEEANGAAPVEPGVHQQHLLVAVVGLCTAGVVPFAAFHLEVTAAADYGVAV